MDGQAETAPVSTDELARFLVDNPDSDRADDAPKAPEPDSDDPPLDEDQDGAETPDADPDDPDLDPDAPVDQTSQRKFKVTVKGEDGADLEQEVEEKELIAGYQRHSDYTRKTQDLARREEQAVEVVRTEVGKAQNHYIQQAQLAHAAVVQLAGLKSPQEMAVLAQTDPASWAMEQQRASQINAVIAGLQNQFQQTQFQQRQQQEAEQQKAFSRCWGTLGQKGIDKPKLQRVFETIQKDYGIPAERFTNLADPALVMVMHDAAEYRALLKKKAEVTKKSEGAPRLPQKGNVPRATESQAKQVARLRSGKGTRGDLASFIAQHNL